MNSDILLTYLFLITFERPGQWRTLNEKLSISSGCVSVIYFNPKFLKNFMALLVWVNSYSEASKDKYLRFLSIIL